MHVTCLRHGRELVHSSQAWTAVRQLATQHQQGPQPPPATLGQPATPTLHHSPQQDTPALNTGAQKGSKTRKAAGSRPPPLLLPCDRVCRTPRSAGWRWWTSPAAGPLARATMILLPASPWSRPCLRRGRASACCRCCAALCCAALRGVDAALRGVDAVLCCVGLMLCCAVWG